MLNNFIYAQSKAMFEEQIAEVPNEAIVFIEDTKEIWTHGTYFDCSTLDPSIIPNIQTEIDELRMSFNNKADKATTVEKEIVGELEMVLAHGISNVNYAYALPDTANGDEDDVLLSQHSVKTINGEAIYGSGDISTFHYGVCDAAADTADKTVAVSGSFSLITGAQVVVKFTLGNTAKFPTLNVNNTGAKNIAISSYSRAWYMNLGDVLTFVYDGTNWYCKSSSATLTSGNVNMGYSLQTINNETCGLAIANGASITNGQGDLHIHHGGTNENAIYCTGGNIVTATGAVQGNIVHNTRTVTATTTLNAKDNIVLCNNSSVIGINIKMNQVLSGQVLTIIKSTTADVTVSTLSPTGMTVPYLRVLSTSLTSVSSHALSGIGVWNLYCIGDYIYLYKL